MLVDDAIALHDNLHGRSQNWRWHRQQIAELIWPDMADFTVDRYPGERRSTYIYDATAPEALEKFSAAMESMLTPRQQVWQRLEASEQELNKYADVKAYFEEVTRILFALRHAPLSGFYSAKHMGYKSLGAFGDEVLLSEEVGGRYVGYEHIHCGDVEPVTNSRNQVVGMFRRKRFNAFQAAEKWGDDPNATLPPTVIKNLEGSGGSRRFEDIDFLHVVLPRKDVQVGADGPLGMPFESQWICLPDKQEVSAGGYYELPYLFSRYTVNSREDHGRSPAMLVLGSIETANEMQKTFLRAGHKVVDPPLLTYHDAVGLGSQGIGLRPGWINYQGLNAQGQPLIQPLQTGARLDLTEGMLEKEREAINEAFLVTLFQILVDTPNMTATEALLRAQEKGQLIAPTIGRQQSEMLGPMTQRDYGLAYRMGLLPELPGILMEAQGEYEIVYESPAMRMQRSEEAVGVQRTLEMGAMGFELDPLSALKVRWDRVLEIGQEVNGAPVDMLVPEDEYREARASAQQQQRQQAELEKLQTLAPAANQMAQAGAARGAGGAV